MLPLIGKLAEATSKSHFCDTDYFSHGRSLITFDPKAEARLRLKIDLYVVPSVALLYLFCFIGKCFWALKLYAV